MRSVSRVSARQEDDVRSHRPERLPARRRLRRRFRRAARAAALLLGCLVTAGGLTQAAILSCPELAEALGGPRVRQPGPDGKMSLPMLLMPPMPPAGMGKMRSMMMG